MNIEKNLVSRITVPSTRASSIVTSRTYRGISTVADSGTFPLYDISLIKQDITNHFHIRKGEKLENPNFGTIIWDVLFEPLTDEIRDLIIEDVTSIINYDPRVRVVDITVSEYAAYK